jgi:hypothetical protein
VIGLLLLLIGCPSTDEPAPDVFHISFTQDADGAPVELDNETPFTNAAGNPFGVATLRYFVSDVVLLAGDEATPLLEAHFVDIGDEIGVQLIPEDAPAEGIYDAIAFTFGLSAEDNVDGAFPDRPESTMGWPSTMGEGYHYMQLEGRWLDGGQVRSYALHTGPLDGFDRSIPVELEGPFDVSSAGSITLSMDVQAWMATPFDIDLSGPDVTGGVMGNDAIQALLFENGHDVWSAP